jgi:hypothetical protein
MEPLEESAGRDRIGGETKRDRFIRIAQKRTLQVMDRLRILSNCSNKTVYEYGPDDVAKIFNALQKELEDTRRKFEDRTRKQVEFKL